MAFTGSRRVAEQIAGWAAPRLKALSLELGGHGPLVVLPDADLDVAAEVAVDAGLRQLRPGLLRGQPGAGAAGAGRRPARAHARAHRRRRRSGRWPPTAAWRATTCCSRTPAPTARTVEGGEEVGAGRLSPALVTGAGPGVRLIDEEPFTPIVAVMEVPDTAAAIAEANRPDYGLVGYVCGRDMRGALEAAQALEVRDGRDQRLAGGGALRPLRRLARLGGRLRARTAGPRGLRPLAAPARPGLGPPGAVHAAGPDHLLDLGPRPGQRRSRRPRPPPGARPGRAGPRQPARAPRAGRPPPPRPGRRPPPRGRRGCRWRATRASAASSATTRPRSGAKLSSRQRATPRAPRGSSTTVGVKWAPRSPSPTSTSPPAASASARAARARARAPGPRPAGRCRCARRRGRPPPGRATAATRRGRKSSQTPASTIIRLADMHSWPALAKPPRRRGRGGRVEVGARQHDHGVVARALGDVGPKRRAGRVGPPEPGQVALAGGARGVGDDRADPGVPDQRLGRAARAGRPPRGRLAGHAPASASSTMPVVARTREEGRQTTALPAASAEAATRVGTQTGELAACQPSTTP